jgi:hypothetical protein
VFRELVIIRELINIGLMAQYFLGVAQLQHPDKAIKVAIINFF